MTKSEIIARLQNGETMDNIAAEISTMMTEAEDEYAAIQKAEEEAKSAAEEKIKDTEALNEHLYSYISKWYPDIATGENPCSAEMLIEMFELAHQTTKDFEKAFFTPEVKVIHSDNGTDLIKSLFRAL